MLERWPELPHPKMAFPCGSAVKNTPASEEPCETRVRALGQEDPLEEEMATHSSILTWRIPWARGAWQATVHEVTNCWTQAA